MKKSHLSGSLLGPLNYTTRGPQVLVLVVLFLFQGKPFWVPMFDQQYRPLDLHVDEIQQELVCGLSQYTSGFLLLKYVRSGFCPQ